jgi:hypothetical protein
MNDLTRTPDVKKLPISIVTLALLLTLGAAAPAGAESTTTTVTSAIRSGAKGTTVGQATFERTRTAEGQTLTVTLSVPAGIDESHVCISSQPFTQRATAGQCPYTQGATGTTAVYTIDLGSMAGTIYVQAHVVIGDETAYAGWQPGRGGGASFYGNVAVEDPGGEGTPVPVGAIGVLALSGVMVGGLALRRGARR